MTSRPTLYRAGWVLPVAGTPFHRGEVFVGGDGRIAGVGPAGTLDVPSDAGVLDLGDTILLPGLVNVHAHPELTMFRGALEDLSFREWIPRLVATRREALVPGDDEAAATWALVESVAGGVTTIAATEASGAAAGAMTAAGVRGIVYQEAFGPDPARVADSMRTLEADLVRVSAAAGRRVRVGVSPHAPYTVSDALYQAVTRLAVEARLPMAVHIAESRVERDLVVHATGGFAEGLRARGIEVAPRGRSPIDLLDRLGVLAAHPLLIHAVDIDEADIAAIADAGCAVAHCPIANAKLGHGIAPVSALRDAGVTVGIGTDSVASNNRLDLLEEARVAAIAQRAAARRHDLLSSAELLRMCTIGGARALGLDDRIGTLEVGKEADLCAVAVGAPHTVPAYDPVVTLFHAARGTDVILTVVGGQVLYERGVHRTIDVDAARAAVTAAGDRVRSRG